MRDIVSNVTKKLDDDKILECLIKYEKGRKMEASRLLKYYCLEVSVELTLFEALGVLKLTYEAEKLETCL